MRMLRIITEVRAMRNNPKRWLIALIVVLALHGVVLGGLLMQRSANTTPTSNSIAVQTQVAAAGCRERPGGATVAARAFQRSCTAAGITTAPRWRR